MTEIVSRADARAQGKNHYFTGEPCLRGHVGVRYVQSGACYECIKASTTAIRERYAAERDADTLRPLVVRFARETIVVTLRVPEDRVASVGSIVAGMLAARFEPLVGSGRVQMEVAPNTTRHVAGSCMAAYLIHRDDREAVENLARQAMHAFAVRQSQGS